MFRPIVRSFSVLALTLTASAALAATEPLSHLPLYPGIAFTSKDTQNVCGTKVAESIYSNIHGDLPTVDRWYATHLSGFTIVHGKNRPQPFDIFVNADRTDSITISATGAKASVDAVIYRHNPKPAGPAAQSIIEWIEGGAALCL